ncbi:MAG: transcription antitermination protein NusB [bacterium]|nr:transcription antitermination protein NusB [bacterium]
MSLDPVRRLAWDVLQRAEQDENLDAALDAALGRLPDERDRRFLAELVKGTLRWRGRYDHLVRRFSRRDATTPPPIADVLRLGLHQLLGMDRVPDHAAIHQSVALAREVAGPWPAPFVNGLLQSVKRRRRRRADPAGRPAPDVSGPRARSRRLAGRLVEPPALAGRAVARALRSRGDRGALPVQQPAAAAGRARAGARRSARRRRPAGRRRPSSPSRGTVPARPAARERGTRRVGGPAAGAPGTDRPGRGGPGGLRSAAGRRRGTGAGPVRSTGRQDGPPARGPRRGGAAGGRGPQRPAPAQAAGGGEKDRRGPGPRGIC